MYWELILKPKTLFCAYAMCAALSAVALVNVSPVLIYIERPREAQP